MAILIRRNLLRSKLRALFTLASITVTFFLVGGAGAAGAQRDQETEAAHPSNIISIDEIRAGQRGYGLTAFFGSRLERFDVEVLGVIRNLNPGTSYIVARLTGHNLETSGVPQGMSGSPVYIDDRLAGAVSFGWTHSQEAIAGITAIEDMRNMPVMLSPPRSSPRPSPRPLAELTRLLSPGFGGADLSQLLLPLENRLPAGAVSAIQWVGVGFGDLSRSLLRRVLGEVALAGSVSESAAAPDELVGGSPVAAIVVSGDLQIAATGTVTERRGDEILAFGHPFLGSGPTRLPMAQAEVVTVVSSRTNSFKIANVGPIVGSFEHDGHHGVRGRLGTEAPMMPVQIEVQAGDKSRSYDLRIAEVPDLVPALITITTIGAMEVASFFGGVQGLDLEATFVLEGYGALDVRQSYDGATAVQDVATFLGAITSYLQLNSLERVDIERIEIKLFQVREPRTATLLDAYLDGVSFEPGSTTKLHLRCLSFQGGVFDHTVEIDIPASLPAGRYGLLVGGGASVDSTRMTALEPINPVNFEQVVRLIRSFHSRRQLVILGLVSARGLAVDGEVLPNLPTSVRSLWSKSPQQAVTLRSHVVYRRVIDLEYPLEGAMRLEVEIKPRNGFSGSPTVPRSGPASG